MQEGKTIGQLMEEMRQKAGAQNYHGHDYMDLQRFAENTRHMIIFDVLTHDSPVGWKGERTRLFLSEIGYEKDVDKRQGEKRGKWFPKWLTESLFLGCFSALLSLVFWLWQFGIV